MTAEASFADGDAVLAADGLVAGYTCDIDILHDMSRRMSISRV